MSGYSASNGHWFTTYRSFLLFVLLIFLLWGCGGDTSEQGGSGSLAPASADTGSASFAVQWGAAAAEQASTVVTQAIDSCETAGVASISGIVYDDSNSAIASGGPWNCSDHQGTISQIPAGSDRTLAILGWNAADGGGDIVYQGQTGGITIKPGQNTDAGTIDARPFVPDAPAIDNVYGNQIDLSLNDLGVAGYRIYRYGVAVGTSASTTYSDTGLSPLTEYCYTVSARDSFANESGQSDQTCAETTDEGLSIFYRDADNDSFGNPNISIQAASPPSGYVADNTDCNDSNGDIYPGADEICNDIDDDCDKDVDEGLSFNTYYEDSDDDGYGSQANTVYVCKQPPGYVADATDCDDNDPDINPGEKEICYDGTDNNCDGVTDDNCAVINPTSSFTARVIGEDNVLVGDASNQEGKPFNSTFLSIKEGTSDRVCLEFDITGQPVPTKVTLEFQMSNLDSPAYSPISLYSYNANGLANAEDYYWVTPSGRIETFSDNGASGRNPYTIDITNAYRASIKMERTYMGILLKANDTVARYYVYDPVLTLSY